MKTFKLFFYFDEINWSIYLMTCNSYSIFQTRFGKMGLVFTDIENGYKIKRIYLPSQVNSVENLIKKQFVNSIEKSSSDITIFIEKIIKFLEGKIVEFDLDNISLDMCSDFQKRVLLLEFKIPRGWISTYGRIAARLGVLKAGRAVGNALARNPFPIVIPCHRAIQSNGDLGGFQGGIKMKKTLLKNEGIKFLRSNSVLMENVYY
jgi:methylated-DNA-[protein]-cysteine S-methyltransferase